MKIASNFQHFEKKDEPHSFCISKITDWEGLVLDQCPKIPVSEHPSTVNMLKGTKNL